MRNLIITKAEYKKLIRNKKINLLLGDGVNDCKATITTLELMDDVLFFLDIPEKNTRDEIINVKYED